MQPQTNYINTQRAAVELHVPSLAPPLPTIRSKSYVIVLSSLGLIEFI